MTDYTEYLPAAAEWNSAVSHSRANPSHVLGPYDADDGTTQMECSCGWDSAPHDCPMASTYATVDMTNYCGHPSHDARGSETK